MDDETKKLWMQEIRWRDEEVERLKKQLFETRKKIVDASTPTDYTGTFFVGALLMFIMWAWSETGSWFWLIVMGGLSIFMIFMTMFYSNIIVPNFLYSFLFFCLTSRHTHTNQTGHQYRHVKHPDNRLHENKEARHWQDW